MSEKIRVKILFFAKIKEIMKKSSEEIELEHNIILGKDVFHIAFKQILADSNELQAVLNTCMVSLNDEYIDREQEIILKQGDEISILPPISAG